MNSKSVLNGSGFLIAGSHTHGKKITSTNKENTTELSARFTRMSGVRNVAKDKRITMM